MADGHRERILSSNRGCYRCGKRVTSFGGVVCPAVIGISFIWPRSARWWTDCKDCGRVEVAE